MHRPEPSDAFRCLMLCAPALSCSLRLGRRRGEREHGAILPGMTLRRGNVADAAVAVLFIVPVWTPSDARRKLRSLTR